jgi:hypothetical protein
MDKPIVFEVKYRPEDAMKVADFVQRQSFLYRHDALLTGAIVFLGFAFFIFALADDVGAINILGFAAFSLVPACLAGVLVYLIDRQIAPRFAKRRVNRYFDSSPTLKETKQIEISAEGIRSTGELGSSLLAWPAITKVVESPSAFLVYLGNEKFPGFYPTNLIHADDLESLRSCLKEFLGVRASLL